MKKAVLILLLSLSSHAWASDPYIHCKVHQGLGADYDVYINSEGFQVSQTGNERGVLSFILFKEKCTNSVSVDIASETFGIIGADAEGRDCSLDLSADSRSGVASIALPRRHIDWFKNDAYNNTFYPWYLEYVETDRRMRDLDLKRCELIELIDPMI